MGKLVNVYKDHEIRWTKSSYHILNPNGILLKDDAKSLEEAIAFIARRLGLPIPNNAPAKAAATSGESRQRASSAQHIGDCCLESWESAEARALWKQGKGR